jgi:hypothetical protein
MARNFTPRPRSRLRSFGPFVNIYQAFEIKPLQSSNGRRENNGAERSWHEGGRLVALRRHASTSRRERAVWSGGRAAYKVCLPNDEPAEQLGERRRRGGPLIRAAFWAGAAGGSQLVLLSERCARCASIRAARRARSKVPRDKSRCPRAVGGGRERGRAGGGRAASRIDRRATLGRARVVSHSRRWNCTPIGGQRAHQESATCLIVGAPEVTMPNGRRRRAGAVNVRD